MVTAAGRVSALAWSVAVWAAALSEHPAAPKVAAVRGRTARSVDGGELFMAIVGGHYRADITTDKLPANHNNRQAR
jgi:hypothetical protein